MHTDTHDAKMAKLHLSYIKYIPILLLLKGIFW